ncbi:MAG: hypothetical protein Q7R96_01095 [Nanoarchaeota archaeon]|nr:hypothetical protein [Nanoarchaeota archaeon]
MKEQLYFRYYGDRCQLLHLVDPADGKGVLLRRDRGVWSSTRRCDLTAHLRGSFDVEGFCTVQGYRSDAFPYATFYWLRSITLARPSVIRMKCAKQFVRHFADFKYMIERPEALAVFGQ